MVSTTYSTGSWLGIVRSGAVIVLKGHTEQAIVGALWEFLGQEPTIHGVLNEVTRQFGTELTGLPDFAIVVQSDRLHAILRGDMALVAHTGDAMEIVSGRDVTTWSERSLPLPESLELTLAQATEPAELSWLLPVGEAVIRLQSLHMELAGAQLDDPSFASGEADWLEQFVEPEPFEAEPDYPHDASAQPQTVDADGHLAALLLDPPAQDGDTEVHEPEVLDAEVHEVGVLDAEVHAADTDVDTDVDDDVDHDAYASFAMAAEAADAEWNAQLAPMAALNEADLNLTIRPDMSEDESHEEGQPAFQESLTEDVAVLIDAAETATFAADADAAGGSPTAEVAGAESDAEQRLAGPETAEADTTAPETAEQEHTAPETADDGFTTNYDHLFGPTVARSVEDAAVRLDDDEPAVQHGVPEAELPPLPPLPPVAGLAEEVAADLSAAAPAQSAQEQWQPEGLLIDSVPWAKAPESGAALEAGGEVAAALGQPYDPDHDGHTVMRGDVSEVSGIGDPGDEAAAAPAPLESRPPTGPMVLARMCPNGHANPPSRSECSDCGAAINSEPREVGRPRLGTMHISSGEVIELDHSLIIGRQPSVSRVMGGAMPRLVQVNSGNDDISRSHVEVRLDGWDVLLVDLKATNGTVLVREGQAPRRLSQGEEAILLNGDIAELGDGISLLFEGLL
ncbi:FHA domain-containing protein [Arthrobacter sp. HLT1-20]